MSTYLELIKEDLNNIDKVINLYNQDLVDYKSNLVIMHKRIDIAVMEQAGWYSYYDTKRVELKTIYDYIGMQLDKVHSILWKKFTEKHSRELTQKDKDVYIKQDPAYMDMAIILLHTKEVYEQYVSVVESFKMRGYSLNNLTKLRVAQQEDWIV